MNECLTGTYIHRLLRIIGLPCPLDEPEKPRRRSRCDCTIYASTGHSIPDAPLVCPVHGKVFR